MDSGIQADDFNGRALQKVVQSMVLLEKCFSLGLVLDDVTVTKVNRSSMQCV